MVEPWVLIIWLQDCDGGVTCFDIGVIGFDGRAMVLMA